MAPRAIWRGRIKFADFHCDVGLFSAISSSEKISFNIVNRKTGNRVERQYLDSETGDTVERDAQVKGYELDNGEHLVIEGDELEQLMPDSNKIIAIKSFIACQDVDTLYLDRPYYLAGSTGDDHDALCLLARTLRQKKVAALGEAILFRRNRVLLVRPDDDALIATTLNYDYEVRSKASVFKSIPALEFDAEMLDLASHIIKKRSGSFDPARYSDRYNDALQALIEAKIAGKTIARPAPKKRDNVIDLKQALRQSAEADGPKEKSKPSSSRRKEAG